MTTSNTDRPFGFWTATALIMGGKIGSGIFLLPVAIAPYGWTGELAWITSIKTNEGMDGLESPLRFDTHQRLRQQKHQISLPQSAQTLAQTSPVAREPQRP